MPNARDKDAEASFAAIGAAIDALKGLAAGLPSEGGDSIRGVRSTLAACLNLLDVEASHIGARHVG